VCVCVCVCVADGIFNGELLPQLFWSDNILAQVCVHLSLWCLL